MCSTLGQHQGHTLKKALSPEASGAPLLTWRTFPLHPFFMTLAFGFLTRMCGALHRMCGALPRLVSITFARLARRRRLAVRLVRLARLARRRRLAGLT